jgi:CHAT domain-containing protein
LREQQSLSAFSDAIIIPHKQPLTNIPLPTNLEKLQILAATLQCRSTPALTTALAELWDYIVHLVVDNLRLFAPEHSRIWWCPMSVFNFSLSVSFAAIGQDCPASASHTLEYVEPELELVRRLLPDPPTVSFTKITNVDATKSRALHALRDNTWLHFSCHGTQKYEDPFNSAFLMRDEPLSLLDITQTDLSQHEFAFLSACDTAVLHDLGIMHGHDY